MSNLNKIKALLSMCFFIFLAYCSGCATSPESPDETSIIQGKVVATGSVVGATVEAYAMNSKGKIGRLLGTAVTDSNGNFRAKISTHGGPIEFRIKNGSYVDIATGRTFSVDRPIRARISKAKTGGVATSVAITFLTEIASQRSEVLVKSIPAGPAIRSANRQIAKMFGIKASVGGNALIRSQRARFALADEDDAPAADGFFVVGPELLAFLVRLSQAAETAEEALLAFVFRLANDAADGSISLVNHAVLDAAAAAFIASLENTGENGLELTLSDIPPVDGAPEFVLVAEDDGEDSTPADVIIAVLSNNGGPPSFCYCLDSDGLSCTEYTGSLFASVCNEMGPSCPLPNIFGLGSCPIMDKNVLSRADGESGFESTTYY